MTEVEKMEYLSDEELLILMMEAEADADICVPPGLAENILEKIDNDIEIIRIDPTNGKCREKADVNDKPPTIRQITQHAEKKKREFHAYCFRVAGSAAAAILAIFLIPAMLGRYGGREAWSEYKGDRVFRSLNRIEERIEERVDESMQQTDGNGDAGKRTGILATLGESHYLSDRMEPGVMRYGK